MSLIEQAKENVRLIDYLISILGEPTIQCGIPRWHSCPKCGESDHANFKLQLMGDKGQFYRCWKCDARGDVVQAAQDYLGLSSIVEAARSLLSKEIQPVYKKVIKIERNESKQFAVKKCLKKIFEATEKVKNPLATDYLLNTRMLPMSIVLDAQKKGLLRFLPSDASESIRLIKTACGEELLKEAEIWRLGSKAPGIAFRPLLFFFPNCDAAEFRIIRDPKPEEPKAIRYGIAEELWKWEGIGDTIAFCEGAIDMLSMPALDYKGTVYGIPGCNTWNDKKDSWLAKIKLAGKKTFVCFDNDTDVENNPGQRWAKELVAELGKIGANPINRVPKEGMDVNKMLIEKLTLKR